MPRLTRVCLKNICNVTSMDVELSSGIVGVLGPNGSGKTTLLNSVYSCLTNDFSWHAGNKSGVPTMGTEGQESSIRVEIETGNGPAVITRRLAPTVESVLEHGGRRTTVAGDIARVVQDLLGVSQSVLRNFVFVDQWQLFSFLTAPAAVRLEFLSAICDTERIEACWKQAGEMLSADQRLDNGEALAGRRAGVVESESRILAAIADNEGRVDAMQTLLAPAARVTAWADLIRRGDEAGRLAEEFQSRAGRISELDRKCADFRKVLEQVGSECKTAESALETLAGKIDELSARRDSLASDAMAAGAWRSAASESRRLNEQKRVASERLAMLSESVAVLERRSDGLDAAAVEERCISLRQSVRLRSSGKAVCETCGTPLSDVAAANSNVPLAQLKKDLADAEKALAARKELDASLRTQRARLDDATESLALAESALATAAKRMSALRHVPDGVEAEWRAACSRLAEWREEHNQRVARVNVLRTTVANRSSELRQHEAESDVHKKRASEIRRALASAPSKDDVEAAKAGMAFQDKTRTDIASLTAVLDNQRLMLADVQKEIVDIDRRIAELGPLKAWLSRLEGIRATFHRDALPKYAVAGTLQRLLSSVNQTLSQFGAPFTASVTEDDVQFVARFARGSVGPKSLSGAQKVMLALAIRLSVGFGFLALDEPTAGLDAQVLAGIIDSIHKMRERIRNAGGQIIIVTHEAAMTRVFDQVIRLGDT